MKNEEYRLHKTKKKCEDCLYFKICTVPYIKNHKCAFYMTQKQKDCTHCYGTGCDHGDESMETPCYNCK